MRPFRVRIYDGLGTEPRELAIRAHVDYDPDSVHVEIQNSSDGLSYEPEKEPTPCVDPAV